MLTPLLLLWPMSIALTWLVAQSIANQPFDRELEARCARWRARSRRTREQRHAHGGLRCRRAAECCAPTTTTTASTRCCGARGELLGGDARPAAAGDEDTPRRGEVRFRDDDAAARRCASPTCGWPAPAATASSPLVQVAETLRQALAPGHRDHQGRDPAAVRDPAAGGAAGLAGAGARHRAAAASCSSASAGAHSGDLSPIDEQRRAGGSGAAGARDQRPAGAAGRVDPRAEALPGRRRAPAEDAARRAAHAGRAGRREIEAGQHDPAVAEAIAASRSRARASSAAHMVNQLLAMARAEARGAGACASSAVNLARLASEVVRDFVPRAMDKRIDLGYEGPRQRAHGHAAVRDARQAAAAARAGAQPGRQRAALHAVAAARSRCA